ncbi:hypothetical protein Tco_1340971, partial [Tanacetum coccineum]
MKPNEPTYQVILYALAVTTFYPTFLITAEVPVIHMHQEILNICPKISGQEFDELPLKKKLYPLSENLVVLEKSSSSLMVQILWGIYYKKNLDFVSLLWEDLSYQIDNKDSKKQMYYPRFTKVIIHHFLTKDKSISMRNRTFMHTARDDSILSTMRFVSKQEDTQVYGALLPKAMTNQAMRDSDSYKTYYAIATRDEPPKLKKIQKKSDLAISSEETPSKKKPAKSKKDVPPTKKPATKPKPTKKKAPVKDDRGKGDGTDVESRLMSNNARSLKESWGDSGEEDDDDEDDTKDESDHDKCNDDDGNNDDNDDDSTELDRDENPNLNQSNEEHEEKEEEYVDERVHTPKNHELTDEEDNANNAKEENEEEKDDAEELYRDVNVNLRKEDVEMTDADQGGADQHNLSQESGFEHVEEDTYVTLTTVHAIQKTE